MLKTAMDHLMKPGSMLQYIGQFVIKKRIIIYRDQDVYVNIPLLIGVLALLFIVRQRSSRIITVLALFSSWSQEVKLKIDNKQEDHDQTGVQSEWYTDQLIEEYAGKL